MLCENRVPSASLDYPVTWLVLVVGDDSLRKDIAFPKTQTASDLLFSAPSEVAQSQLDELHLRATE